MLHNRKWVSVVSTLVILAIVLAACQAPATPPPGHPLSYEKVRQAIAMGIDRQAIVDKFYPTGSTVASHFTPCAIPGGCEGEAWYAFDREAAKRLLAEAGYPNGFDLTLAYRDVVRSYLPTPGRVAEELQAQLKELGINATIEMQEGGTFLDNASNGKLEIFLLGWNADYPDATNFLDSHMGAGANDSFGAKFDDVTSALAEAASLADQTARNALYATANTAIKQHVPMVPVAHGGSATVFTADATGGHASPLGNESFKVVEAPGKETFVWMQNAEPLSLYCADETDGESLRACEQIFDPLLTYEIGGVAVEPNIAEMPVANDDLTEWTVTLRDGVTFSDGTPLTAQDVVATYAVQWDRNHPLHVGNTGNFDYWTYLFLAFLEEPPATATADKYEAANCDYGGLVRSIEAVDEQTVKFTMCAPDPAFPSKIAFSSVGIQSAAHLEETGGGGDLLESALGSGPYIVDEWVRGDHLTLVANPNYWGEPPLMPTVIFRWNSEAAARLTALKAGEVDAIDNPDPNDFATIEGDSTLTLFPREALNIFYIGLNNNVQP
ncbi:MAG TPA: ABC transporter substrate-binding protein [Anaerolineae bacterium]|nr:ABC transporter substrate-binding protein [Anaerolineae bacterium]